MAYSGLAPPRTVPLAVAYKYQVKQLDSPPTSHEELALCEPIYETLPGWQCNTHGITEKSQLPKQAITYLDRIEALLKVPITMISTGADRKETIILSEPFVKPMMVT